MWYKYMFKFSCISTYISIVVCIDVIGAFHELGYTQTIAKNRKIQINLVLKDLKYVLQFEYLEQLIF
jgi:hypothetical protein